MDETREVMWVELRSALSKPLALRALALGHVLERWPAPIDEDALLTSYLYEVREAWAPWHVTPSSALLSMWFEGDGLRMFGEDEQVALIQRTAKALKGMLARWPEHVPARARTRAGSRIPFAIEWCMAWKAPLGEALLDAYTQLYARCEEVRKVRFDRVWGSHHPWRFSYNNIPGDALITPVLLGTFLRSLDASSSHLDDRPRSLDMEARGHQEVSVGLLPELVLRFEKGRLTLGVSNRHAWNRMRRLLLLEVCWQLTQHIASQGGGQTFGRCLALS